MNLQRPFKNILSANIAQLLEILQRFGVGFTRFKSSQAIFSDPWTLCTMYEMVIKRNNNLPFTWRAGEDLGVVTQRTNGFSENGYSTL